ncbi:MAG: hypothetical protein ACP5H5_03750 [Pyrobaculum sp.]
MSGCLNVYRGRVYDVKNASGVYIYVADPALKELAGRDVTVAVARLPDSVHVVILLTEGEFHVRCHDE